MKKIALALLLALVMVLALPVGASTPQTVVATLGAWAPPVFLSAPGDTVQFQSADVLHRFATSQALCINTVNGQPRTCNEDINPGVPRTVRFHSSAARGSHQFTCSLHPWMVGELILN